MFDNGATALSMSRKLEKDDLLAFLEKNSTAQDILCKPLALSCAAVGILSIAFKKHYSTFQKRYICNGDFS
jgi:hypothetical protein